jgi:hypothetical protein
VTITALGDRRGDVGATEAFDWSRKLGLADGLWALPRSPPDHLGAIGYVLTVFPASWLVSLRSTGNWLQDRLLDSLAITVSGRRRVPKIGL